MTDYFALLDEPRLPWIDPERLKQKFLARSAEVHPDRVHNAPEAQRRAADASYSELNTAYQCLREPRERLRHLLELETGTKLAEVERIPPGSMDAGFEVARLCREADAFITGKAAATSPLLKVQFFERAQVTTVQLMKLREQINLEREQLLAELQQMNSAWGTDEASGQTSAPSLARLEQICRLLGYFGRWSEQLQERIFQLSI